MNSAATSESIDAATDDRRTLTLEILDKNGFVLKEATLHHCTLELAASLARGAVDTGAQGACVRNELGHIVARAMPVYGTR